MPVVLAIVKGPLVSGTNNTQRLQKLLVSWTTCVNIKFYLIHLFSFIHLQQFGKILDVEIIFNERGSKVRFHNFFEC